ncbi:hypothetical protein IMCC3317_12120 [Kordia antarctica]|uniref:Uncharacterized protein n=1 Tax=Kordia antarctica TaxID=1218801 RepID=A0A7L4ZIW3_9FLAO|nr:hypothetical protein [Kordia antarctica]QHI35864.1 hypothetical protein IMCC3317_12120 [Kordia antarctica]
MNETVLNKTITWWETKRIIFNAFVGIVGIFSVFANIPHTFGLEDFIGIILWGIVANIFYSVGILLEIVNQYYLKGKLNIFLFRHFFFIIGTLMYMFLTWSYTFFYYYNNFIYSP